MLAGQVSHQVVAEKTGRPSISCNGPYPHIPKGSGWLRHLARTGARADGGHGGDNAVMRRRSVPVLAILVLLTGLCARR